MNGVEYRLLGPSGCVVSSYALGTMTFGAETDEAGSFALLDQFVDAGGTFIDTANCYSHWYPGGQGGESETVLGQWMRDRKNRAGHPSGEP